MLYFANSMEIREIGEIYSPRNKMAYGSTYMYIYMYTVHWFLEILLPMNDVY